jgi:glycerol-3-phosphate responsive antiterminator
MEFLIYQMNNKYCVLYICQQYQLVGIFIPATSILALCYREDFLFIHTIFLLF